MIRSLLDDRIRLQGSELVVMRGGVERRYDWRIRKEGGSLKGVGFMGYRYEVGDYRLDPRYLIQMPSDADLAEMAEMRANVEASV